MKKQVVVYDDCWLTRDKGEFAERGAMIWYGYFLPPIKGFSGYQSPFNDKGKVASDNDLYRRGILNLPNEFFKRVTFKNKPKKCKIIIEYEETQSE